MCSLTAHVVLSKGIFQCVNSGYNGCSKMYNMWSVYDEYVPGEMNGVHAVFS